MDTGQHDNAREETETEVKRDEHQREQVEAQAAGDTGAELKAFLKETVDDQAQFAADVVADTKDPERRIDEEQGTATQPGSEPAEAH